MIVAEAGYEVTDPTVDSQIVKLQASGADIFVNVATPKFAAQAIRKVGRARLEAAAHPQQRVELGRLGDEAGRIRAREGRALDRLSQGRRPTRPWKDDAGMKEWTAFMDKYFPDGDRSSSFTVYGYASAQTLVQVLKQCRRRPDPRERHAAGRQHEERAVDVLIPGITMNTSPTDFFPIEQMQMMPFDGENWDLFGPVISGELGG